MAKATASPNYEILEAALQGLEAQRQKLDEQIAQVRTMLGRRAGRLSKHTRAQAGGVNGTERAGNGRRRVLSAEARKRIAAAQKKRWAAFRKDQA